MQSFHQFLVHSQHFEWNAETFETKHKFRFSDFKLATLNFDVGIVFEEEKGGPKGRVATEFIIE